MGGHRGRSAGAFAALLAAIAVFALAAASAQAADGERVFDPELSLIGGCNEEALDPVEDPGCPTTPPAGAHPPNTFANPSAVATDFHGNIYVASYGTQLISTDGRIDIFDSTGRFITEIESEELKNPEGLENLSPLAMAIDSDGVLYVLVETDGTKRQILSYTPCAGYEPEAGEIEYCNAPALVAESGSTYQALAINADNDHLFSNTGGRAIEYGSATEGNPLVRETWAEGACCGPGMAVDATRDLIYVSTQTANIHIEVFDLTSLVGEPPGEYEQVASIEDSDLPKGDLGGFLSVAVDEATGHLFVLDTENKNLYEFDADQNYMTQIEFDLQPEIGAVLGVDNGPTSPNKGYLFVPSHRVGIGHSFAFEESVIVAPEVKSPHAANVSEAEAELVAQVNPGNAETTYRIEYTTEESFEAEEFEGAAVAGEGTLAAGNLDVEVSAVATGLSEATAYRFRVFAENEKGDDEGKASFATYPSLPSEPAACPNALLRTGPSALLPDCRAYELVTLPDTNGRAPLGVVRDPGTFTTRQVSPSGGALPYKVDGGSLPGFEGTGGLLGDPYLATRGSGGWSTTYIGPTGAETESVIAGSTSPDQGYSIWIARGAGTAVVGGDETGYVRFPDGHSELLGQGSLPVTDPRAFGRLISEGGEHIVFTTGGNTPAVQLEPDAAPNGTDAIYDRVPNLETGERETKVVSLKPGDEPFGAGEDATYMGSSLDGEGIAFKVGSTLYLRYRNSETYEIGSGITYAGLAEGGSRLFYLEGAGDLMRFDALAPEGERVTEFTTSGNVTPVFVAGEGSAAYFHSPDVLPSVGEPAENPEGATPLPPAAKATGTLGAKGTGTLTADSTEITDVTTSEGAFEVGMRLSAPGIPNGTTIAAVGAGTLTLSQLATETGARSLTAVGSKTVRSVSVSQGSFAVGMHVSAPGIPVGTTIAAVNSGAQTLTLSEPTTGIGLQEITAWVKQNLYLSREGQISFLGTVTDRDVEGEFIEGIESVDGLGLWTVAANPGFPGRFGVVPARATPDGNVLLFKSRAQLTDYDPAGKAQIYRYDAAAGELQCLSCNPTGQAPSSDATLQTERREGVALFFSQAWLENLRADGRRAFFESSEPLVPADSDGRKDVYQWEAQGVGSCTRPQGCVSLISSPASLREEYLWAVSESGDDVFFFSSDLLVGADADTTASIYDARVGGGFPEDPPPSCAGEGCRPHLTPPPSLPSAASSVRGPGEDVKPRGCAKGKRKVKRAGKVRCVKRKSRKQASRKQADKRRAGAKQKGARR